MEDHTRDRDATGRPGDGTGDVMAAIDDAGAGSRLVIADLSQDESWVSASTAGTVSVADAR